MNQLEKAIEIALKAHEGQKDKAGLTYIIHPLRLMLQMQTDDERITAVLHDVVEDSTYTFDDLRKEGFSEEVIAALKCVTKQEGEGYDAFIERIAQNPLAVKIKIADLKDNADLSRLSSVTDEDRQRVEKYKKAITRLEKGSIRINLTPMFNLLGISEIDNEKDLQLLIQVLRNHGDEELTPEQARTMRQEFVRLKSERDEKRK